MSHRLISKVGVGAFDHTVLDRACTRCGLPTSTYVENHPIEDARVTGHAVQIPKFSKPAIFNDGPVIDPVTKRAVLDANGNPQLEVQCHYDNWTWDGYQPTEPLDLLKVEYNKVLDEDTQSMVEEAQEIARRAGQTTSLDEVDGVMVLTVSLGE